LGILEFWRAAKRQAAAVAEWAAGGGGGLREACVRENKIPKFPFILEIQTKD